MKSILQGHYTDIIRRIHLRWVAPPYVSNINISVSIFLLPVSILTSADLYSMCGKRLSWAISFSLLPYIRLSAVTYFYGYYPKEEYLGIWTLIFCIVLYISHQSSNHQGTHWKPSYFIITISSDDIRTAQINLEKQRRILFRPIWGFSIVIQSRIVFFCTL